MSRKEKEITIGMEEVKLSLLIDKTVCQKTQENRKQLQTRELRKGAGYKINYRNQLMMYRREVHLL